MVEKVIRYGARILQLISGIGYPFDYQGWLIEISFGRIVSRRSGNEACILLFHPVQLGLNT